MSVYDAPRMDPAGVDGPEVSVVVPARNAERGLPGLLQALADQSLPAERYEVLVVDDGSRDGTAAAARSFAGVAVLANPGPRGSYAARNAGIAAARGRVVAFTDADCRPVHGWLEHGLAELGSRGADLVGGRVDVPLPENPNVATVLDAARFLNQERSVNEWGYAATANLFAPKAVIEEIGGFDERLRSGGDVEFCDRALAAGHSLVYSEAAAVTHEPRANARAVARKATRVGTGLGQMRALGVGPWARRPRLWTSPRAVLRPRGDVLGLDRLERRGYRPRRTERAALIVAQHLLVQLPMVAGQAAGELRTRVGRG